jgi:diguanylate cyclase (GGDEF)-like protein
MTQNSSRIEPEILQDHPEDAPPGWAEVQEKLAISSGLSILLVDGHQPPALAVSNNNSICHAFQSSPKHVSLCDPYCGDAHHRAISAGTVAPYKCHAGLQCFTMPVQIGRERKLAAIGGRAFVTSADYRSLIERFRAGDLTELLARHPFENVIFADQQKLDKLAGNLERAARNYRQDDVPIEESLPSEPLVQEIHLANQLQQLRNELDHRSRVVDSLRNFLERISSSDPTKTYSSILRHSKELLNSNRASLLVFDEGTNELIMKAAEGLSTEAHETIRLRLGEGISGGVLQSGRPLMVDNVEGTGLEPAPVERNYKTKSFISYPITIGGRKIGVLNVTDKSGGGKYDQVDLSLLELIGPQVAVALERAEWQERATEFQLMSITDPLTSLPNRRYLEERLLEELSRSKRHDYPMSFLMIDIDDFKNYNDMNGHQAGDLALQITGHCLKAALRSADVAARYGGEEFCVLLPQTKVREARSIAERMRQRVAMTTYPHGKSQPGGVVTISIGVSAFTRHIDTPEKVIAAADRALYTAKHQGKDRIEIYQEDLVNAANISNERN